MRQGCGGVLWLELCGAEVARANSFSSPWQQERSNPVKWLILSLLLGTPPRAACVYVHGCGLTGKECLARVPCGHLLTELLRSAAPCGPSGVISSPKGACDSSLDGGITMAAPRALLCFTSPSVLHPVAVVGVRTAGEVVTGGSLVQSEGSRGSPNP